MSVLTLKMLRAGDIRNKRRRELRHVKACATSQLRTIQDSPFAYRSVVTQAYPNDDGAPQHATSVADLLSPQAFSCDPSESPRTEDLPDTGEETPSEDESCDQVDSDDSDDAESSSVVGQICDWAKKHNITHAALNDLLSVLREKVPDLPRDARTLLATPRVSPIRQLSNGEYVHFGLKPGLLKCLSSGLRVPEEETLHLTLNLDGLPLFSSSNHQVWPILAMVTETNDCGPFPVGIFSYSKKPASITEYVDEFIQELRHALKEGVECLGRKWKVAVRAVVCDYPARTFAKSSKGHTAYYGCDKCTQCGAWAGRVTFPETKAPLRTDASFAAQLQEEHHYGTSPFCHLGLGMISQFPIDYMHLVLLGVVRKFTKYWMAGPLPLRRSVQHVNAISHKIALMRPYTPCDFSRKLRGLNVRDKWKATESRQFLLYVCPVVLKGILSEESFQHFMTLHVAIRLLCTKDCPPHLISYAEELLNYFVERAGAKTLYGNTVYVYNVHALIHLAQDVRTFGPLDSFSSFPFENYLGSLKRKVRSGNKPLAQLYKRLKEKMASTKFQAGDADGVANREHTDGPVPPAFVNARQFKEVVCLGRILKVKEGDNCVLLKTNKVGIIKNILSCDRRVSIVARLFRTVQDLYTYPCRSSFLDVMMVSNLSPHHYVFPLGDIKAKCFLYPSGSMYACFPILHSQNQ